MAVMGSAQTETSTSSDVHFRHFLYSEHVFVVLIEHF